MRTIAIPLLMLSALLGFSQVPVNISPPISVTNNSIVYGRHLPRVDLFSDGTPVVFWSKSGGTSQLFLAVMGDTAFSDPVQVPTGSVNPNVWGGGLGPDFAVRDSVIFVVFEKYGDAIYCVRSTDRGQTFSDPVIAYDPPAGRFATLPTVFIDEGHNPMVGFISTNSSEEDAISMLVVSSDGGDSFGPAVSASDAANGSEVCECCPSGLLVDQQGDVFFSFRNNDANTRDIWVARSSDNGMSFPDAVDIDETNWFIQGCPSTGPQSFDMGTGLVSVFFSGAEGWQSGIYMSTLDKSNLVSGPTFKLPTLDGMPNNQNYPRIDGNGDTLGVVWHENVAGNQEIIMAYSTTGPAGLMENIVNISDSVNSQAYPDIAFSDGRFHIVYEDQNTGTILYQTASLQQPVNVQHLEMAGEQLSVYPNPVVDVLSIRTDESHQGDELTILDLSGRQVARVKLESGNLNLHISSLGLKPGVYFCKLASDIGGKGTKFIVK